MSIAASVKSVSPTARALTEGGRLVAFKSFNAPATQVANAYQSAVKPNRLRFSERVSQESEDQFVQANEVVVGADQATIDDQVSSLTRAVQAMTYTARNVIVPTVDALVNQFASKQTLATQPNVSVDRFKYHDVHSAPSLLNHVSSKYTNVQPRSEFRTFILTPLSPEAIISLVSEGNPHIDSAQVVEWLLGMGADRINAVWSKLYGTARLFDHSTAPWMQQRNWPVMIDELLLAYCLTGALREHPQDPTGESVDLKEWELALGILHELLGSKLLQAYNARAQDVKAQRMVLATDATDPMRTGQVSVLVNGDVYPAWLAAGGDVQALLGVAVFEPAVRTVPQVNAIAGDLVARWTDYYPLLRQSCIDNALRGRRRDVVDVFLSNSVPAVEGLPVMDEGVVRSRLDAELRVIDDEAYDKPCQLFAGLVCRVYYPTQPLYYGFMRSMDRYARVHPNASGRELAIEATIELVATWLAGQVTTVAFTPDIDPNAVSQEDEGDANVKIDGDNQSLADNVGEVQEEPLVNEVDQAASDAETELDENGNPIPAAGDGEAPLAGDGTDGTGIDADGNDTGADAADMSDSSELPTDDPRTQGDDGETGVPGADENAPEGDDAANVEEDETQQ
jgi:hypothetical protein